MTTEDPCAHEDAARPEGMPDGMNGHPGQEPPRHEDEDTAHCMQPIRRYDLHDLVKANRKALKLTSRDLSVLHTHLTVLPKGALSIGTLNISFMSVEEVCRRTNHMEERTVRRAEVRLEKAGLIQRRLSGNGRRFPVRVKGVIVDAYGIDLTPLIAKADELRDMMDMERERCELLDSIRCRISAKLTCLKRALAEAGIGACTRLIDLARDIRNKMRRVSITLPELRAIEEAITAVMERMTPRETDADLDIRPCQESVDTRQTVRHSESHPKESQKKEKDIHPDHQFDAMEIGNIWDRTGMLRQEYPNPPRTEEQMQRILYHIMQQCGLTQDVLLKGLRVMGWAHLIKALDYFSGKVHELVKPNVYFSAMVSRYMRGEFVANSQIYRNPKDALCDYEMLR